MKSVSAALTLTAIALTSTLATSAADPLAPRPNGMAVDRPSSHILIGATIHLSPTETYDSESNPAILIENGTIVGVFKSADTIRIKPGYQIHQLDPDQHIYAGFIDAFVEVDAPEIDPTSAGVHWNSLVTPQRDVLSGPGLPDSKAKSLREMGFTTAMIAPDSGVFRGWTATVSTASDLPDPSLGTPPVYQHQAGQMLGFDRSNWQAGTYPTSHMGVISLMRQSFRDAESLDRKDAGPSCLAHITPKATTLFYDTSHELEANLAGKLAQEFGHKDLVIIGAGTEHRRLQALISMGFPVVTPLTFPDDPDVWTVDDADSVSLAALQHWERAPANARWLSNSGLTVALTTSKLRKDEKFFSNLKTAIKKGLPASDALAMLTTNPAQILELDNQGEIKKGNIANLVVTSDDLFDPDAKAKILETWIDGREHHINDPANTTFDGTWKVTITESGFSINMIIEDDSLTITEHTEGSSTKASKFAATKDSISFTVDYEEDEVGAYVSSATILPDGSLKGTSIAPDNTLVQWTAVPTEPQTTMSTFKGSWDATLANEFNLTFKVTKDKVTIIEHVEGDDDITQTASSSEIKNKTLNFTFDHTPFGMEGDFSIALTAPNDDDMMMGLGTRADGAAFEVTATKSEDEKEDDADDQLPDLPPAPFGPYALSEIPPQDSVLITNATIWTQSDDGILEDAWIIIRNGKIHSVGTGGYPRIAVDHTIDAQGKHVTPGLIDAHSHTGLFRFGVNETGQAVTSEVRIEDSLDPGYIGFYRELAGGLTTSLLLHGSANPIGGQSKTVKLRWGSAKPQDMYMEDAKPGIKFALGENVKQSNWGDRNTTRYPQTRLGVETIMRDRFTKAREYAERGMKTAAGDTDLELEALAEILAGERLIHCHSYRQDEILMLCRLAEEFGFKIGTFQHGLETYKVAEIVKEHAIGASIFSDWWAYKVEVTDAIPYAGPINHEVGLLTSFNSDSDDVARRMHVEAAKALKYARASGIEMSQQDALAFVTTNPAIQLDIIDRVGTLEAGKDADLVIWSGSPLSSLSRCEATYVDGRRYFSLEDDQKLRVANDTERTRLIQLVLTDGKPKIKSDKDEHDHEHNHDHSHDHDHLNFHQDLRGDCGCSQLLPAWSTDY
ncbi:MAG: amidohydrolase family protein [Phycisphaerales bacterium]|nr:amidohydrolase family protein [Phycisphaerales bacterium]